MTGDPNEPTEPDAPTEPEEPTDSAAMLAGGSEHSLAEVHDIALVDLDGVVYTGPAAVPGAIEGLAGARSRGMRVAFVTNNASRPPGAVAAHLAELGVPAGPDDVVTSAQAAATLVAGQVPVGSRVLVVGGEGLYVALRERGLRPVDSAADGPAAVVQGFAPEVGWRLLAQGTFAVRRGLPWIASNLDATVPTAEGIAPGNGALVQVIRGATGQQPQVAGKPEPPLHEEAVRRTGARRPLVVGDRLDTDIEGANRVGAPSLLVLTGVSGAADLLVAAPAQRPGFLAEDLPSGLLEPHPAVTGSDAAGWTCGGWTVRDGDRLRIDGEGDRIDALRALCVAAWRSGRAGQPEGWDQALVRAGWPAAEG